MTDDVVEELMEKTEELGGLDHNTVQNGAETIFEGVFNKEDLSQMEKFLILQEASRMAGESLIMYARDKNLPHMVQFVEEFDEREHLDYDFILRGRE